MEAILVLVFSYHKLLVFFAAYVSVMVVKPTVTVAGCNVNMK